MEETKNALIGRLYYELSKQDEDFKLAIASIVDGCPRWSKHRGFLDCCNDDWFIAKCNNRSILKCEIVLDVDCKTIQEAKIQRDFISHRLKEMNVKNFDCYFTGSRGFHFHIFKPEWNYHLSKSEREQRKKDIIEQFQCDGMKAYEHTMIAMENCPHWKTGNKKELVERWMV